MPENFGHDRMLLALPHDGLGLSRQLQYNRYRGQLDRNRQCHLLRFPAVIMGSVASGKDEPPLLEHLLYLGYLDHECRWSDGRLQEEPWSLTADTAGIRHSASG